MSGLGRKHVSKWDFKEDTAHHPNPNADVVNSGSHYRDKDPRRVLFNAADSNESRRSSEDQHSGQARSRSRVSQDNDNSYYSEQDGTRQQFSQRSDSRSYSRSRSRSRSPVYRARRDHAGSYDRHQTRTRDESDKRGGDQSSSDYGWEDKASREPRETRYHHSNDSREEALMRKGARSSDYNDNDFPKERSRREHLHDGVSDPRLRRQRSEVTVEKEAQRRDGDGEGRFLRRSSDIPCKFFAAGNCRNGQHCRFSHHGGADRNQPQDNNNNFYRQDSNYHSGHNKWNGDERMDDGKFSKGASEIKGNGGSSSWIGDMEMSPDWNYNLKKRMNEEAPGVGSSIAQSLKSRVDDQRSSGMYSYGDNNEPILEKPIADSHQNYNIAPVEAFNQSHNVLLYQNSPTPGGTQQQVIAPAAAVVATDFSLNLSNPESGKAYQDHHHHSTLEKAVPVQSGVTREQIDQISNISATIAQFLANPQLTKALQMPESSMAVQPNSATQSNNPLGMIADTVSASQVSNVVEVQELPVNPKASEGNGETKTTKEASKEEEYKKAGEEGKDAENVVGENEDDDGSSDEEEDKKEMKDPKGMRTFKFALVEIVKELLKPAWKEGKMKKDGYKNIVKKVVEKVTGSLQSGSVPTTQEKIDHYLSASKPKLTKLVQAYVSKVKKT